MRQYKECVFALEKAEMSKRQKEEERWHEQDSLRLRGQIKATLEIYLVEQSLKSLNNSPPYLEKS